MGSVNTKELFFIHCVFHPHKVHTLAFMLANMERVAHVKKRGIFIGGLITFIVFALGLGTEITQLHPLEGSISLDLNSCLAQKLVKLRRRNNIF